MRLRLLILCILVGLCRAQQPVLSVSNSHIGNFTQGQLGATYTVIVGNGTQSLVSQVLSASANTIAIGSASCNDFQTVSLTSSGAGNSPIAFTVAINYPNGTADGDANGAWLYASLAAGGATSTGAAITGTTSANGALLRIELNRLIGNVTATGQVIVTPTSPAAAPITITVNYTPNANCGNTGSLANGFIVVSPGGISFSAPVTGEQMQTVTIQNISGAAYAVELSAGQPWDFLSTGAITLSTNQSRSFTLTADPSVFVGVGHYTDTLVISPVNGYAGGIISIPVQLTVTSGSRGTSSELTVNGSSNTAVAFSLVFPTPIPGNCVNLADTNPLVTGYSWDVTTANGGNWLLANNSFSGSMQQSLAPGTSGPPCIHLSLNPGVAYALASGAYQGTVAVSDNQQGSAAIVANLYVSGGVAQGISVSPGAIYVFPNVAVNNGVVQEENFTLTAASGYTVGSPVIMNTGGGFGMSAPAVGDNSITFSVTSDSSSLLSGLYAGTITIPSTASGGATSNTTITVVQPVGQAAGETNGGTTTVVPTALAFQQQAGSTFWTSGLEAQAVTIAGAEGSTWSAAMLYSGGNPGWLNADNASNGTFGAGPATLLVDLFNGVAGLAPSDTPYQATLEISTQSAGQFSIPVSLLVTPADVPVLLGLPASTTFTANTGANPASQSVTIEGSDNPSSTTLPSIAAGTPSLSWLTATASGNTLTLNASTAGLSAGVYSATVPVSASAYQNSIVYPVVLVVKGGSNGETGALTLSSTGLSFTNVSSPITQNLTVTASAATQFTLASSETSCVSVNWLQVLSGNYSASATPTQIAVTVNPSGVAGGATCSGVITLTSGSSAQTVTVSMTVAGGASGSGNVIVNPSSMTFIYSEWQALPRAQNATVVSAANGSASIPFAVSVTENSGASTAWLIPGTSAGVTPCNNPGLSVGVAPGSLSPGTYTGTVTITPAGGTAQTISVTLVVTLVSPTSGAITVAEAVPAGLTLLSLAGSGWTCPVQGATCTRGDPLPAGESYPPITVSVSVAPDAPPTLTNQVTVTGGSSQPASANDLTNINPMPSLTIIETHSGSFTQGQADATYSVMVSNGPAASPTIGTVKVMENVPDGLTLVSMGGDGWTCPGNGTSCSRNDPLNPAASYSPITVTVNVGQNAPSWVTNQVTVSGGGSFSGTANDLSAILSSCGMVAAGATVDDVQQLIGEALGTAAGENDLTAAGLVSVVDVQIVLNAVLGYGCSPTSARRPI